MPLELIRKKNPYIAYAFLLSSAQTWVLNVAVTLHSEIPPHNFKRIKGGFPWTTSLMDAWIYLDKDENLYTQRDSMNNCDIYTMKNQSRISKGGESNLCKISFAEFSGILIISQLVMIQRWRGKMIKGWGTQRSWLI